MNFAATTTEPARVGNTGSGGAAVGPGWLLSARFDRHFIATTAAIAILSGIAVAMRPGLLGASKTLLSNLLWNCHNRAIQVKNI